MYQTIVLGLGVLLVIGGGYLIEHTDKQGVIRSTISATSGNSTTTTQGVSIAGVYLCDAATGCPNPRTLTLAEDGGLKMNTYIDNGVEVMDEVGSWAKGTDGTLTLFMTGAQSGVYKTPHALEIKYVSPSTLSGISYDPSQYKDVKNPVFLRQGDPTQSSVQDPSDVPTGRE